jgi:hypothetical protein
MRTMKIGLLFLILMMLIFNLAFGQTSTAAMKITDFFSADEMK